jgi:cytochrome c553
MARDRGPFAISNPWQRIAWSVVAGLTLSTVLVGFILLPIMNRAPEVPVWDAICTALGLRPVYFVAGPQPTPRYASTVAWSYGAVRDADGGDPHAGEFVSLNCAACHGAHGVSGADWIPSLAGMRPEALVKQLVDFQTGHRNWPIMGAISNALSADDIRNVAAYYATLPIPGSIADPGLLSGGRSVRSLDPVVVLMYAGDPRRGIAPCSSCHGIQGLKRGASVLAGQHRNYLQRQLVAFRGRLRRNDEGEQMRVVAAQLTDREVRSLAAFLSGGRQ